MAESLVSCFRKGSIAAILRGLLVISYLPFLCVSWEGVPADPLVTSVHGDHTSHCGVGLLDKREAGPHVCSKHLRTI